MKGERMLSLTRKAGERVIIGAGQRVLLRGDITVQVLEIRDGKVRLGFSAPKEITIHREEVLEQIEREQNQKDQDNHGNK